MKPVRVGVIGGGWWAAENHIPVLQSLPGVEVPAVCRLGKEELRRLQDRFSIPHGFEDYRELLDGVPLDAVVVSSPHHLHHEHAKASMERGLHVLCEKPMTLRAADARELVDLAERRGLHFLIPHGWNYTELAADARRAIRDGRIGNIEHVHCHMASSLRDLFSGQDVDFAREAFFQPMTDTWSDPRTGGGFAHGQLTHALGLMFYITDMAAREVFAMIGKSPTGADLFNSISFRFTNGATCMAGGAATMPDGSIYQVDIRVFGTEGMLMLDIERPRLELRRNDGRHWAAAIHRAPGLYECIEPLRVFVDLVRGNESENRSTAALGARVVEVLDAALRSAESGQLTEV